MTDLAEVPKYVAEKFEKNNQRNRPEIIEEEKKEERLNSPRKQQSLLNKKNKKASIFRQAVNETRAN